jgi:hypothetical protein
MIYLYIDDIDPFFFFEEGKKDVGESMDKDVKGKKNQKLTEKKNK